jgi:hypothetical protein
LPATAAPATGSNMGSVLYTLGTFTWGGAWLADTFKAGQGVTNIVEPQSGDFGGQDTFKREHGNPPKLTPPTSQQAIGIGEP